MNPRRMHTRASTYAGLLVWGASGFMAQPTLVSGFYHLVVLPAILYFTIFVAHREGYYESKGID